jgi:choline dehydrogenase-like flavoprotein
MLMTWAGRESMVYTAFVKDDNRVVVIGSGPAGAAAAVFLTKAGVNVLLLEAGAQRAELGLTLRLRGMTVAKHRRALQQRAHVRKTADAAAEVNEELAPGGLSNHWSCAVPRFSEDDFRDAARAGTECTWPIGYSDIAPWYDSVEPLLHIAGSTRSVPQLPAGKVRDCRELAADWQALVAAAEQSGRDIVPMPYAYGAESTVTFSGTVFNAFVRLVKPMLSSESISVRYSSRAVRLEWSAAERRVTAVVFRDGVSGLEGKVSCRAVVVAAGAINTAEVLLASTSAEFPDGLGNTHGVLGRYLHDHPLGKLVVDLGAAVSIHPATYVTRRSLDRSTALYAAAGMQWSGAAIYAESVLARTPGRLPWIGYSVFGTMAPTRDNYVALDPKRNEDGDRTALELHVSHPPEAIQVIDETRDQILDLLTDAGLKPTTRVWKIEEVGNSNHYGGTCRMHDSPEFGMLDRWSRMHGVPNVVVADSAAFTTGPEKNPVLTAMALSARASHRLAQDLTSGAL